MPIYEFHCKECRHEFKTLRRTDQLDSIFCPTCGTGKVARLLSVTARTSSDSDSLSALSRMSDGMPDAGCCMRPGGCCMNPGGCDN